MSVPLIFKCSFLAKPKRIKSHLQVTNNKPSFPKQHRHNLSVNDMTAMSGNPCRGKDDAQRTARPQTTLEQSLIANTYIPKFPRKENKPSVFLVTAMGDTLTTYSEKNLM